MPKSLQTPDRLFDRTWRPGHPFRPRISHVRRWVMRSAFLLLCVIIGGYWYITDSNRVGKKAEEYLSTLLGGHVRVGDATLSIFEGLRLDDVNLYVSEPDQRDSLMFSAKSFVIEYSPRALLTGKIEATKIVAVDPRVHVIEDADTGRRNYSRMVEARAPSSMPSAPSGMAMVLPEIILRNAQIEYTRVQRGHVLESSSIGIEGQLKPLEESKVYAFAFQSRAKTAGLGPTVQGHIAMGSGQVQASLQNFEFGEDVKTMLPPDVRKWWEQHDLTGRVAVPVLSYVPPTEPGTSPGYKVVLELQGVTLAVRPEEWMGDNEHRKVRDLHRAFEVMRFAGINSHGFVDHLSSLVEPAPVNLKQVHGRFIFSDDETIQIEDLNGWVEDIHFKIAGKIKGYTPAAEANIRIASSDFHDIEIPAAPRYLTSLPPAVREMYDDLKPRGTCRFWIDLVRDSPGARPKVNGQINIIDGNFTFIKFPYPIRKATGQIILSTDPDTGEESLRLDRIRGRGLEGGPNANTFVEINGTIGPFGPEARVDVVVAAQEAKSEAALLAAFPSATRKALSLFDAPGKGEFPKFSGDFACNVVRLRGLESKWIIETSIHLEDASGQLVTFPYPMTGISGDLKVHDDNVELINIGMTRGDSRLKIDGRISWTPTDDHVKPAPGDPIPPLRPNLRISATDVPIDADLLSALPPARREWLQKVGAGGKFDLEGTIKPATGPKEDLDMDFRIALRDGTLLPVDGGYAASNIEGNLRLTNQRLTLSELRGKRGDTDLSARGEIIWPDDVPKVVVRAEARDLMLDASLYKLLPDGARSAWDQVRPDGTVDVTLSYSGTAGPTSQPGAAPGGYELVLTPRKLSATPLAVPYKLEQLGGTVTVMPDKVFLRDLVARHGDAKVRIAGIGTTGPQQVWDFTLAADDVMVDDDLHRAVPPALADMLKSIQMRGKVNFEFTRLKMTSPGSGVRTSTEIPSDIDFTMKLGTSNGSVEVGVPLTDVKGTMEMTGSSRNGKLWTLRGRMDFDSLTLSGRPVTKFHAELYKPPGQDQLTIGRIEAALARGSMAGQVDYGYSDKGPSRYAVNLALQRADVRELAGETEQDIQGQLSASLAIEGRTDQPASRRGRGIVEISGDRMYRIPLVLGLLQITNLQLPTTSPITQASARYSIEGSRVSFEHIEMRSREMLMQGNGNLDFDTKEVRMSFSTDSTNWPKIPFVGEFIQGARNELLRFHVSGTLQEPKVSARSMNTLTTTIDRVFKGDDPGAPKKK